MYRLFYSVVFLSSVCFGSGKLQLKESYFLKAQKAAPQIGVSIYEKLVGPVNYNGWTGIGWQPRVSDDTVFYAVSKHDLEVWLGNVGLSVGYGFRHADKPTGDLISEHDVHVGLNCKLW